MAHYKAPQYRRKGSRFGEQRWCSGESTRPPPMWPGFDSQTRRHMWVEFVGSLLCSERFFLNYSSFPLSSKTYIWLESPIKVVSFAAVIRVIMQCSSPLTAAHSSSASLSLNWPIRSRLFFSWKTGPLAANVTRNMIGAAAYSCMHVVGSQ